MSDGRPGMLRRVLDWFFVEEPSAGEAPRARSAPPTPPAPPAREPASPPEAAPADAVSSREPAVATLSTEQATYPPPWAMRSHGAETLSADDTVPLPPRAPAPAPAQAPAMMTRKQPPPVRRRRGFFHRLTDWFFVYEYEYEDGAGAAAAETVEPRWEDDLAPAPEPLPRRRGSRAAWVVVVLALAVAGVVVAKGLPQRGRPVVSVTATTTAAAKTTPTVTAAQLAADVARARTAAGNAAQAAQSARAAAQRISVLLASAKQDAKRVAAVASPVLARNPSAADPSKDLAPLQQAVAQGRQAVNTLETDATSADGAANAAASLAQTAPAAATFGNAASSAAAQADHDLTAGQQAQAQIGALLTTATSAVTAWDQVHSAPRGVLGITVGNPPPTLGVQGCEVLAVQPGSAGSAAGLVGAAESPDGVGDVITGLADATDASATWTITDCGALQSAMAQTRIGDHVTVTYMRSQNLVFTTQWVQASGSAVLGQGATASATASATATGAPATGTATAPAGTATASATASGAPAGSGTATSTATAQSSCPAPITGTITPVAAGSRIELPITLSGPGGDAPNLRAILDTGGVATTFPDGLLRQLGYRPYGTTENSGVVPGATAIAYLYHVPGSAITALDGGRQVALATGTLDVIGIPGGSNYTLGPDILEAGSRLSTAGSQWSLTPPC